MDNQTALQLLTDYRNLFPAEHNHLQPYISYLAEAQYSLYDRKNANGHITASAFILNRTMDAMVLIAHKNLKRWLQPGGHVDASDAGLIAAALREATEETGIAAAHLTYLPLVQHQPLVPFDIDPHWIPENAKKQEPGHYHHDHRFLFLYTGDGQLQHCEEETEGIKWVSVHEMANDHTFTRVVDKLSNWKEQLQAQHK
ncbi:MAG: NUDIX domain-containing protein [Chitinophagia bacterium]|nr:NUDIX domain-containing protein [Chitinophagia bacterium]